MTEAQEVRARAKALRERREELEKAQGEARRVTPEKRPSIRERLEDAKRECGERKPPDKAQVKKPPERDER